METIVIIENNRKRSYLVVFSQNQLVTINCLQL